MIVTVPAEARRIKFGRQIPIGAFIAAGTAVSIVPQVSGSALSVVAMFLLPVTWRFLKGPASSFARVGLFLWIFAILLSGLLHSTSAQSIVANLYYPISIIAVSAFFMFLVAKSYISIRGAVSWVGVGLIAGSILSGGALSAEISPLKLGLGLGISLIVLAVASGSKRFRLLPFFFVVAIAAVFVLSDFRSMGAMLLVAAIAQLVVSGVKQRDTNGRIVLKMVTAAAVAVGAVAALSLGIANGVFGEEAQMRFEVQSESQVGLLQAARPETIVSTVALRDSWATGRGYGQALTGAEASDAVGLYASLGMPLNAVQENRIIGNGINSHSLLLTTWIATGISGAIGLGLIVLHVLRAMLAQFKKPSALISLTLFTSILVTWDSFFSPWNPRYEVWLGLAVMLAANSVMRASGVAYENYGAKI